MKVTVVGAGAVGATCADKHSIFERENSQQIYEQKQIFDGSFVGRDHARGFNRFFCLCLLF